MDALKAQLAKIQEQLAALSASQKMLAGSLVAIMVLTLLFWGRYASSTEMEAVLDQSLKPEEIVKITNEIRAKGVEYKVVNDRVMVPADRKLEVLADLSYAKAVPSDTHNAYDEIIKQMINPLASPTDNDATRNYAKAQALAQVIRRFPNVASADVILDPSSERRIGEPSVHAVATVAIATENPTTPREDRAIADAVTSMVSSAQAGLNRSAISVIVNLKPYQGRDADAENGFGGSDDILNQKQQATEYYNAQVNNLLSYIAGVHVNVYVDLSITKQDQTEVSYDPKTSLQKESHTESETTEETGPAAPAGEPGAIPNAPLSIAPVAAAGGGAGEPTSSREKNSTEFDNFAGTKTTHSSTPAGKPTPVSASINVPRSYFVDVYKQKNSSTKDPDDTALAPIIDSETARICDSVMKCIGIEKKEEISVQPYFDAPLLAAASLTKPTSAAVGGTIGAALTGHLKEIALAALAIVSLFMVSSMTKKATPAPVIAAPVEAREPGFLGEEDVAGDVGEGSAMLDGMELDEDSVKAQQMVDQVSTMVKENPEAAATMVKRWLNRT